MSPAALGKMIHDADPERTRRVIQVMFTMDKLDIKRLEEAYRQ